MDYGKDLGKVNLKVRKGKSFFPTLGYVASFFYSKICITCEIEVLIAFFHLVIAVMEGCYVFCVGNVYLKAEPCHFLLLVLLAIFLTVFIPKLSSLLAV